MTRHRATATGFTAVLIWALLALFTIGSAPVPPFLLNAMCFGIGGAIGLVWTARSVLGVLRGVSWKVYDFGTLGLFGYHFLYFTDFRLSPTAETGLIAYLWPLFIVLLSGLLPGERLTVLHIIVALVAFAGVALIALARADTAAGSMSGLALAFLCALTCAAYSVLSRSLERGADRKRHGVLSCDGGAVRSGASDAGGDYLAGQRAGFDQRAGTGDRAGRGGALHLGCRDEAGRHPAFWGRFLRGAAAGNAFFGGCRHRRTVLRDRDRCGHDCGGCGAGGLRQRAKTLMRA